MGDVILLDIERNGNDTVKVRTSWGVIETGRYQDEETGEWYEGNVNHDYMLPEEFEMWYVDFCDETYGHRIYISDEDREWLLSMEIYL